MTTITRKLVLVGAHAGKTVVLRAGSKEYRFERGEIELTGPSLDVDNLSRFLLRYYQAYPEGSSELKEAQSRIKQEGNDVPEIKKGKPSQSAEHAGRSVDQKGRAGGRASELSAAAYGRTDAEAFSRDAGAEDALEDGQGLIVRVLKKLDPGDESAWTADGKPKMAAVEALLGRTDVTRAQVDAALPGFDRDTARETR